METSPTSAARRPPGGSLHPAVPLLLALGLLGHVYAAYAMGGSRIAYTHHVAGFFIILVVTGGIIAGLGRLFWRSRSTRTWLVIAAVQALLGLWIALAPFRAAGHP